jgi:hypothetical protein
MLVATIFSTGPIGRIGNVDETLQRAHHQRRHAGEFRGHRHRLLLVHAVGHQHSEPHVIGALREPLPSGITS